VGVRASVCLVRYEFIGIYDSLLASAAEAGRFTYEQALPANGSFEASRNDAAHQDRVSLNHHE
jgi:hypothetical protein